MTKQIELRCILNIELLLDWLFMSEKALGASVEAVLRISKENFNLLRLLLKALNIYLRSFERVCRH